MTKDMALGAFWAPLFPSLASSPRCEQSSFSECSWHINYHRPKAQSEPSWPGISKTMSFFPLEVDLSDMSHSNCSCLGETFSSCM